MGCAQHVGFERLRGLDRHHLGPIQLLTISSTQCVGNVHNRNRGLAPIADGIDHRSEQRGRRQGPGTVVHQDDLSVIRDGRQTRSNTVRAGHASCYHHVRTRNVLGATVGWYDDDHPADCRGDGHSEVNDTRWSERLELLRRTETAT